MGLRFRVLGPVDVVRDDAALPAPAAKPRLILGVLLARRNQVVSVDALTDALWGDRPPDTATAAIHTYVSQLRKLLASASDDGAQVLSRIGSGYRLAVNADDIDASVFERLLAMGRDAVRAGQVEDSLRHFYEAEALWRGRAFAGIADEPAITGEAQRLDELGVQTIEERIEAEMSLGRHREQIAELEGLAARLPTRELVWKLMMICLYRDGRQADALRAFQRARSACAELGLEPGPELQAVEAAVLRHSPDLGGSGTRGGGLLLDELPAAPLLPRAFIDSSPFAFTGREHELDVLQRVYDGLQSGGHRLVLVGGEAGIGKTRLAFEFARRCAANGAVVRLGTCDAGLSLPYEPWVQILDQLAHDRARELADLPAESLAAASVLLPYLATTPSVRAMEPGDPGLERLRLFQAVDSLIALDAAAVPVVIVVDDIQWAGQRTLELLRHIVNPMTRGRLLVLATFRDTLDEASGALAGFLADQRRLPSTVRVRLDGFDPKTVREFVADCVGHDLDFELSSLAASIAQETAGNAFLVGQVWSHLVSLGAVAQVGDRWSVRPDLWEEIGVPDSIREVVAARIARLDESTRHVAYLIAAAGARVELRVLRGAAGLSSAELDDALDQLLGSRLVVEIDASLVIVQFAHALVREAIEGTIPRSQLTRLHAALGTSIESLYAHDRTLVLADLARHFAAAASLDDAARAVHYSRKAAQQAMRSYAHEEAIAHLDTAIALSSPGSDSHVILLLDRAEAATRGGLDPSAMDGFLAAYGFACERGLVDQRARAVLGLEAARQLRGLPGLLSVDMISQTLDLIDESDVEQAIMLGAALVRALALAGRNEEALLRGEAVLQAARSSGQAPLIIAALQAITVDGSMEAMRLRTLSTELCDLADARGDLWNLCWGLTNLIRSCLMLGDMDMAVRQLERNRTAAELGRFDLYRYHVKVVDGVMAMIDGRFADAARSADGAFEFFPEQREFNDGVHGLQMFVIRREQGRLAEVAPFLRIAAEVKSYGATWRPGLAMLYAELGMLSEAQHEFETLAYDDFRSLDRDALWPACFAFLAEVCATVRDERAAKLLYDEMAPFAGLNVMVGFTACLGPVDRLLGLLAAVLDQRQSAEEHFIDALSLAERCSSRPWIARIQHDHARSLGGRLDLLDSARRIAGELGMRALLASCETAMGLEVGRAQ